MTKFFNKLNLNKKLALIAIVLAVTALIIGSPTNKTNVTINPNELALMISKGADHIEVEELTDWIIQGRMDYRLLDLRDEKSYNEYHIPTAENVPLSDLMNYPVERNEKIILYSDGGIHSSQAWFLLKSKGFKSAYFIIGGLDEWKDKILFPAAPVDSTTESLAQFNKMKEISKFFGGTPVETASSSTEKVTAPALTMPKIQTIAPVSTTTKKKKKEGC
ncbi:MAG TPA: rhodanese-like domain-containing protein [Ignavibacteriaceae bacterium]|nr:rhodanese-like domain-containing protein [Ignavibacteriaceae bacterium]